MNIFCPFCETDVFLEKPELANGVKTSRKGRKLPKPVPSVPMPPATNSNAITGIAGVCSECHNNIFQVSDLCICGEKRVGHLECEICGLLVGSMHYALWGEKFHKYYMCGFCSTRMRVVRYLNISRNHEDDKKGIEWVEHIYLLYDKEADTVVKFKPTDLELEEAQAVLERFDERRFAKELLRLHQVRNGKILRLF